MRLCEHILRKCRSAVRVLPGLVTVCCVSCINEYPDGRTEAGAPLPQGTVLALKVSLTDQAGFASADGGDLPDVEKMRDLRVVITSKDAEGREYVEFNRYIDFSDASEKWRYKYGYVNDDRLMFKLTDTNPEKHVYLFANCEPLFTAEKIDHPDPENGIYGDVGANRDKKPEQADEYIGELRNLTYTNDQLQEWVKPTDGSVPNGVPMSAEYDITVVPGNTGIVDTYVLDAYILRAADKITFTSYTNWKPQYALFVQGWELERVADRAYLLPRVAEDGGLYGPDKKCKTWIEWYADHIINSPDSHGEELGFSVPENSTYSPYNGGKAPTYSGPEYENRDKPGQGGEIVSGLRIEGFDLSETKPGTAEDKATYYFPESRYVRAEETGQHYSMTFTTREYSTIAQEGSNYTPRSYTAELPNVTTLFRNTHVKIAVTLRESSQVDLNVSVINWSVQPPVTGDLEPE